MGGEAGVGSGLVRSLSFHADYRCENTGVCCSSGWDVAVETSVELQLTPRLQKRARHLPNGPEGFVPLPDPPTGCHSAFRRDDTGVCWFRDKERRDCAIHREFGEESLASACRQFPRVAVLEPGQTSVSLSHYCPTAAGLLFREPSEFRIVDAPEAFPSTWPFEGLDARQAYSPLLRPGVLLGFDGLRAFESSAVAVLAAPDVRAAVARIAAAVERIRAWRPDLGPVPDWIRLAFDQTACGLEIRQASDPRRTLADSIPPGSPQPPLLPAFAATFPEIEPRSDLALRRYLAARLIGGWVMFQAEDLAAAAAYIGLCLDSVFLFESARDRTEPEVDRWREAIREADLWLLHYCDPQRLAANLR